MRTLLRIISKMKWIGLLGLPMFFSDWYVWKLFWIFWLFGIVEILMTLPVFVQSLRQIAGIIIADIKNKPMPDKDNYIPKMRETHQLSQKQIAAIIGCTQSAVYRYETGNAEPPIKTMLWYADYFDVSMDYIYGRTENPQGRLYKYEPQAFKEKMKDEKEWAQFVEMCFDPNSPMSARLKETMMQMMGGGEKK